MHHRYSSSHVLTALSLFTLLVLLLSPAQPWLAAPPTVQAQIDNTQPGQAYASIVDCIRSGADLGDNPQNSPRLATTCFSSAWYKAHYNDPIQDPSWDAAFTDGAVYSFGDARPDTFSPPEAGHTEIASLGNGGSPGGGTGLGAVYGLAYESGRNPASPNYDPALGPRPRLYAAAFAKRITRFGDGGPGAIYVLDRSNDQESVYVQVPSVVVGPAGAPGNPGNGGAATFANGTTAATYTPSMGGLHGSQHDDPLIYWASRSGLGDLELDSQGRYLYGVNLLMRSVFRIDTWSANPQASLVTLPQHSVFSAPSSCNGSGAGGPQNLRPFGLKVTEEGLYLGFVCSAESSQDRRDLGAGVLRYDLATSTWDSGLALALFLPDFDTQRYENVTWNEPWQPWTGVSYPPVNTYTDPYAQALVASIDFDENHNMIIGLRDRLGDMSGGPNLGVEAGRSFGDLLLAPWNGSSWTSPSTTAPERYWDYDPALHNEMTMGAATYLPGTHVGVYGGEIATTYLTPYRLNSAGAGWYDIAGGTPAAREELYYESDNLTRFGKSSGLGDIELLCDWRAIGDRIWRDTNSNGMQDSGETDINGVLLNLKNTSGVTLAQVTTGAVSGMTGNYRFYVDPYQSYTVEIDASNYAPGGPLYQLNPTLVNIGDDRADSDAGTNSQIAIPSAGNGSVNITFDAGLSTGANVKITKTGPPSAAVGSSFAYGLLYANDGPSTAQNVIVTDTLPIGITFVSANPTPSSISGQTLTWNLGSIAVGASATIAITVQVDVNAPASVLNSTHISTSSTGNNPGDDDSSVTTQITRPNVWITKTGTASVVVGDAIAYTLSYGNTGTSGADNVRVVDTLPAGLSLVNASPAPSSVSGQTLSWNIGALAAGTTGSITVNTIATVNTANLVTNGATISTPTPGDDPGDNSSSTNTNVQRPNVTITKTGPTTVTAGDGLAYSLAYANNGSAAAQSVSVIDSLPAGVSFVSASPAPSSINGQTLTWNLGILAAGASGNITITAVSSDTLAHGTTLLNNVTISTPSPGDNPGDNSSSSSTMVQRADVYVSKSSSTVFPVVSGSSVSYTIDYGNNGPAMARNVTLSDPMPAQLANMTWQCIAGCSGSGTGTITTLALGDLIAGATGRITVTGTATTTLAREDFTNTATISTPTPETNTTNNQSSVPGAVWTSDLQVIKAASPQVTAGTTFTATLSYRNNGPAPATNISLTDSLPTGTRFVSSNPAPTSQSGNVLTWNLGTLADAVSGVVMLTLISDAALLNGSALVNQAHISTSTPDRTPSNNDSSSVTLVVAHADMRVVKVGPTDVNVGDALTYTITYSNDGPSVARSVVLTDTLPPELLFVSASPAPASNANGVLTWNVSDLAVGSGGTLSVQMSTKTMPQASNTIQAVNMVQIGSPTDDPTPGNNTSTTSTNIHKPEIAIAKAGPSQSLAGERIVYTLMYDNRGAAPATAVVVNDVLPVGMSYISASPQPSRVNGQTLAWNIGDMAAGASGMIAVMVQINADAPVVLVNTAMITTPAPGDDPSNNSSSTNTTIPYAGTIGDTVWRDDDGNGHMDLGEPGLPGVTIALSDATSQRLIATTRTDALGHYLFTGLGSGRYLLRVTAETTQIGSYRGYRLTTESLQSSVIDTQALEDLDRDFGLRPQPTTEVSLTELHATNNAQGTSISWRTIAETNTQRFRVLWSATADRNAASEIANVPSKGSQGGSYQVQHSAQTGFFWLVEVEHGGAETLLGVCWPQEHLSQAPFSIFLPHVENAE